MEECVNSSVQGFIDGSEGIEIKNMISLDSDCDANSVAVETETET